MRGEVPRDADVRLVQAEVHAARRDEVDVPELAGLDQAADHVDRRAVEEGVAGHQHDAGVVREGHQLERLVARRRERLLDEDVLPAAQRQRGERMMCRDGRRDHERVDVRIVEHVPELGRARHRRIAARKLRQRVGAPVAQPLDLDVLDLVQVAHEVRAPVAEAHDRHADAHAVPPGRSTCAGVRSRSRRSRASDQPRT